MVSLKSLTLRQWSLDCGGFLEGEIHLEKAFCDQVLASRFVVAPSRLLWWSHTLDYIENQPATARRPHQLGLLLACRILETESARRCDIASNHVSRLVPRAALVVVAGRVTAVTAQATPYKHNHKGQNH